MSIKQRKKDHVDLCTEEDVFYHKTTGFERYDFLHNALPEQNLEDVTTTARLLGREFDFPLFISSMTGGYTESGTVNAMIAEFCQKNNLPFGVGSQRIMLENRDERKSFEIVREKAPDAFIAANIGGSQLIGGLDRNKINFIIDSIAADAVIVHLNPLQELIQPEGSHNFKGIEKGIAHLVTSTTLPVIVKETGAGISGPAAVRLLELGVKIIDVAGSGGTSWSKVENLRIRKKSADIPDNRNQPGFGFLNDLNDWGIPTTDCIEQVQSLKADMSFELIASGGIRSAFDIAKSMALGADFTATAQPVIAALKKGGMTQVEVLYATWREQLKTLLLLLGCLSPSDLQAQHLRKV